MILLLKSCKFQEHSSKKNSTTIRTLSCCYVKNNQVCCNNIPWLRWWYSILCKLHHISGQESFTASLLSFIHSCKLYVMSALVGLEFAQCSEVVHWKISRQKGALLVLLLRSSSSTSDALAERHLATLASRLPFSRAWASRLSWLAKLTKDEKCSELGKLWEIVYSNAILHVQFNLILGGLWQWRLLQGLSIVLWAVPNDLVHTHWRITWPFAYANYDNAAKYDLNEAAATWARSF